MDSRADGARLTLAYRSDRSAQVAVSDVAFIADIAGILGATTMLCGATTKTVFSRMVTIQMTGGIGSSCDKAFVTTIPTTTGFICSAIVFCGAVETPIARATEEIANARSEIARLCVLALDRSRVAGGPATTTQLWRPPNVAFRSAQSAAACSRRLCRHARDGEAVEQWHVPLCVARGRRC